MAKKRIEAAVETLIASGLVTEAQLVHAADVVRVLATLQGINVGETSVAALTSGGKGTARASKKKRKARKKRGRRGRLASLGDADFRKLYQEMTARELGERYGVTAGAVAARASKLGVKKGKAGAKKTKRRRKAKKKTRGKKARTS